MPIPIPIPMPMGPSSNGHSAGPSYHGNKISHHHQHQHFRANDDGGGGGEGEVKKIYLLQPMAHPKPQPHMKGGGLIPVQNNIHLGGGGGGGHAHFSMSPGRHRHAGKTFFDMSNGNNFDAHQHSIQQAEHEPRHVKSAASEVKILPIVVIPPIAPMPQIQVASGGGAHSAHSARMSLTPQFNNYVLAAGAGGPPALAAGSVHGAGRRAFASSSSNGRRRNFMSDSLNGEYGGSLGGSVFREQYASRTRPGGRTTRTFRIVNDDESEPRAALERAWRATTRNDFDYATSQTDYDQSQLAGGSSELRLFSNPDEQAWPAAQLARRGAAHRSPLSTRRGSHTTNLYQYDHNQQTPQRIKSIRDIIEQQTSGGRASGGPLDVDEPTNWNEDYESPASLSGYRVSAGHRTAGGGGGGGSPLPLSSSMEITLDELALVDKERGLSSSTGASGALVGSSSNLHELNSLYYDRADLSPASAGASSSSMALSSADDMNQLNASGSTGVIRSRSPAPTSQFRPARLDERNLFDDAATAAASDDEWRFDTIKSVKHVEAPRALANNSTSSMTQNETTGPLGLVSKRDIASESTGAKVANPPAPKPSAQN